MTVEKLKTYSVKDLAQMAKKQGVSGWHSMRKEQLVSALAELSASRRPAPTSRNRAASASRTATATRTPAPRTAAASRTPAAPRTAAASRAAAPSRAPVAPVNRIPVAKSAPVAPPRRRTPVVAAPPPPSNPRRRPAGAAPPIPPAIAEEILKKRNEQLGRVKQDQERHKNLAFNPVPGRPHGHTKDRLVVMVRDPFWLHAYWELTRLGVQRAEAALAQLWHTAKPVLRLFEVANQGTSAAAETLVRTITIHGGVNNWYIDVQDPPKSYRMEIGYLAAGGKFFMLARSNTVATPRAGASDTIDENWSDVATQCEKIYAMSGGYAPDGHSLELKEVFEERLRRPMNAPLTRTLALSANGQKKKEFAFDLNAELIIYGSTEADARVTLQGDPVQLRSDGTFTVRFSLPDCRQIIPAVAMSADGLQQRTIVVAVERNTKVMEPVSRDNED